MFDVPLFLPGCHFLCKWMLHSVAMETHPLRQQSPSVGQGVQQGAMLRPPNWHESWGEEECPEEFHGVSKCVDQGSTTISWIIIIYNIVMMISLFQPLAELFKSVCEYRFKGQSPMPCFNVVTILPKYGDFHYSGFPCGPHFPSHEHLIFIMEILILARQHFDIEIVASSATTSLVMRLSLVIVITFTPLL